MSGKTNITDRKTISVSGPFEIKTRMFDKQRTVQIFFKWLPLTTLMEEEAFEMAKALRNAFCFNCGAACGNCTGCRVNCENCIEE